MLASTVRDVYGSLRCDTKGKKVGRKVEIDLIIDEHTQLLVDRFQSRFGKSSASESLEIAEIGRC